MDFETCIQDNPHINIPNVFQEFLDTQHALRIFQNIHLHSKIF